MRRFVIKSVLIVLTIFIFMIIADYYISENFRNSHAYPGEIEVWNDIYNKNINADIAIYGSSRAWVQIDPSIIEDQLKVKAYNFGIDGHNFWLQYLRHKTYLKYNKHPKTIILSVDVFSLAKREDLYESQQFLPFMLWDKDMKTFTSSYKGFSFEDYYFPLVRYYGNIRGLDFSTITNNPYRYKGYRGMNRKWNNDFEKAKLKMNEYTITIDTGSVALLEQFLLECKSDNIRVILVYTPEYIEGQNFVTNRNEIISIYTNFSTKYNLLFLDYSNDDLSKEKANFYNASHLNIKGSKLFTNKLSNAIKTEIQQRNSYNKG